MGLIPSDYAERFAAHMTAHEHARKRPSVDWDAYHDDLDGQLVAIYGDGLEMGGCLRDWPFRPVMVCWSFDEQRYVPIAEADTGAPS